MGQYCITAANHESKTNHIASVFLVWLRDGGEDTWTKLGSKSTRDIVELLEEGHSVVTGTVSVHGELKLGKKVEVELRITRNASNYKISEMPEF